MKFLGNIFKPKEQPAPQPLAIEGIPPAPVTAEPDDAELAAQALLEMMSGRGNRKDRRNLSNQGNLNTQSNLKDAAYYRTLAERIREAKRASELRATRFVAACEYALKDKHLPRTGPGSLGMLEAELYKRIDIVEQVGGELKRRWQHCLAEVTVRLMEAPPPKPHTESTDGTENSSTTD